MKKKKKRKFVRQCNRERKLHVEPRTLELRGKRTFGHGMEKKTTKKKKIKKQVTVRRINLLVRVDFSLNYIVQRCFPFDCMSRLLAHAHASPGWIPLLFITIRNISKIPSTTEPSRTEVEKRQP